MRFWFSVARWSMLVLAACGGSSPTGDAGADGGTPVPDAQDAVDSGPEFVGDPRCAPLYDAMLAAADEYGAPGGGFALVLDGALVCTVPWGIERAGVPDAPVTQDTLFRLSGDWMFLALTTLELAARGELDLDARAVDIVGDLGLEPVAWANEIRVRDLLWRNAGIPAEAAPFSRLTGPCDETGPSISEFFESFDHGRRIMWGPPSTDGSVLSPGLATLLARVISTVRGQPYADVVRDVVLAPLRLEHTYVGWNDDLAARRVFGHGVAGGSFVQPLESGSMTCEAAEPADGNVTASLADAARLTAILASGGLDADGVRLLAESTMQAFVESRARNEYWGNVGSSAGGDLHEGMLSWSFPGAGFTAGRIVAPASGFGLVELTNLEQWRLTNLLAALASREHGWAFPTYDLSSPGPPPLPTPAELAEYVGHYVSPIGCTAVDVELSDGSLHARMGGTTIRAYPEGPDRFRIGPEPGANRAMFWREPSVGGTPGRISTLLVPGVAFAFYPDDRVPAEITALSTCP